MANYWKVSNPRTVQIGKQNVGKEKMAQETIEVFPLLLKYNLEKLNSPLDVFGRKKYYHCLNASADHLIWRSW